MIRYNGQNAVSQHVHYIEVWLYWMWDVEAWNHHHNDGLRNTHVAEAWHSELNRSFGHRHPALLTFLKWIQKEHYSQQKRIRQLQQGLPAARSGLRSSAQWHFAGKEYFPTKTSLGGCSDGWCSHARHFTRCPDFSVSAPCKVSLLTVPVNFTCTYTHSLTVTSKSHF